MAAAEQNEAVGFRPMNELLNSSLISHHIKDQEKPNLNISTDLPLDFRTSQNIDISYNNNRLTKGNVTNVKKTNFNNNNNYRSYNKSPTSIPMNNHTHNINGNKNVYNNALLNTSLKFKVKNLLVASVDEHNKEQCDVEMKVFHKDALMNNPDNNIAYNKGGRISYNDEDNAYYNFDIHNNGNNTYFNDPTLEGSALNLSNDFNALSHNDKHLGAFQNDYPHNRSMIKNNNVIDDKKLKEKAFPTHNDTKSDCIFTTNNYISGYDNNTHDDCNINNDIKEMNRKDNLFGNINEPINASNAFLKMHAKENPHQYINNTNSNDKGCSNGNIIKNDDAYKPNDNYTSLPSIKNDESKNIGDKQDDRKNSLILNVKNDMATMPCNRTAAIQEEIKEAFLKQIKPMLVKLVTLQYPDDVYKQNKALKKMEEKQMKQLLKKCTAFNDDQCNSNSFDNDNNYILNSNKSINNNAVENYSNFKNINLGADQEVAVPFDYEDLPELEEVKLWTRSCLHEFKQVLITDPESILEIGSGEIVTVRVPTHHLGSTMFWEFATDFYDIGFALYFEWHVEKNCDDDNEDGTANGVANNSNRCLRHRYEEEEEEEEEPYNEADDNYIELGDHSATSMSRPLSRRSKKKGKNCDYGKDSDCEDDDDEEELENDNHPVEEIVSLSRVNSHEEVQCGCHGYDNIKGVYLFKFDNSFSLLRSKKVYYRVVCTQA